jgi:hypothetical protein
MMPLLGLVVGYVFAYADYHGTMAFTPLISWEKEQPATFDLISPKRPWYPDYITLPPLFRVKQSYGLE